MSSGSRTEAAAATHAGSRPCTFRIGSDPAMPQPYEGGVTVPAAQPRPARGISGTVFPVPNGGPIPNRAQFDAWNGASGQRWVDDADHRDRVLGPIAAALLDHARLVPGEAVLDLGCGCGATTIAAADAVSPTGSAVGLDLSAPMLDLAATRAGARANLAFVQADAQGHPFEPAFDVVISRFGTMFYGDQTAAFANIRAAMRTSGRLCVATWQPYSVNDWLTVPFEVLSRYGEPPPAADGGPGPFGQSDAGQVTAELEAAGWSNVDLVPVDVEMPIGHDLDDAIRYLTDTGIVRAVLDPLDSDSRRTAIDELRDLLAGHRTDETVVLGGSIFLVRASP